MFKFDIYVYEKAQAKNSKRRKSEGDDSASGDKSG